MYIALVITLPSDIFRMLICYNIESIQIRKYKLEKSLLPCDCW